MLLAAAGCHWAGRLRSLTPGQAGDALPSRTCVPCGVAYICFVVLQRLWGISNRVRPTTSFVGFTLLCRTMNDLTERGPRGSKSHNVTRGVAPGQRRSH